MIGLILSYIISLFFLGLFITIIKKYRLFKVSTIYLIILICALFYYFPLYSFIGICLVICYFVLYYRENEKSVNRKIDLCILDLCIMGIQVLFMEEEKNPKMLNIEQIHQKLNFSTEIKENALAVMVEEDILEAIVFTDQNNPNREIQLYKLKDPAHFHEMGKLIYVYWRFKFYLCRKKKT